MQLGWVAYTMLVPIMPLTPHHSGTLTVVTTGTADADFRLNSAISSMMFGSSGVPK